MAPAVLCPHTPPLKYLLHDGHDDGGGVSPELMESLHSIIEQAKREAEALAVESSKSLAENLERRSKMAEEKIARAEAQALSEVRSAAVDAALLAAEKIIVGKVSGAAGSGLIDEAIKDLKGKLN